MGVGFHPDLTVKENVLVYGSIMGLKNSEVKKRMNSILEFSGLERFKDAKLKNLSSGMQMRLGFIISVKKLAISYTDIVLAGLTAAVIIISLKSKSRKTE